MAAQHAYDEVYSALCAIVPNGVFEIRLLHHNSKRIDSGYFDSPQRAADAIMSLENHYQGVYITPNPVMPDVLARSANRISTHSQITTLDGDILERRWLLVDIDPKRPKGISSTDAERDRALALANLIAITLSIDYGWPSPMVNVSGNGAHLLYPVRMGADNETRDLCHNFLRSLSQRYSDEGCIVDTTVFNAARIWRLPGTWARKGDSTADRPHRKCTVIRHCAANTILSASAIDLYVRHNPVADPRAAQRLNGAPAYPEKERKYKFLNDQAMRQVADWVPHFFPFARPYKEGFRISPQDLGREYEEDLTIHPYPLGIKDFAIADQGDAREGRRQPVGLLAEFVFEGDLDKAARALADLLKAPITEFTPIEPPAHNTLPGTEIVRRKFNFGSIRSVQDALGENIKEQKFVINGVLPTGNVMLASRPKMRKSFLALQLGIAITTGGRFLEWECNKGEVLLLGLEDNKRRIRSRVQLLQTFELLPPDLSGFRFWTGGMDVDASGQMKLMHPEEAEQLSDVFPRGEEGVDAIEQYLEIYPKTLAIFIDTFAHFRAHSTNRDIYQRDYDSMISLTKLAARKGVLIMPIHHEKKGLASQESGDFMEDVSGSSGITGGVDGVLSIKGRRGVQDEAESRKLMLSGRDMPHDIEVDMSFDAKRGGWLPAARQDIKVMLRALFTRHPFINQQQLAALLPNAPRGKLSRCLTEMEFEGEITRNRYGYSAASITQREGNTLQ